MDDLDRAHHLPPQILAATAELVAAGDAASQVSDVLEALGWASRQALAATGVTVMLKDDASGLRFAHADPRSLTVLGSLQERVASGPCFDSLEEAVPVPVEDLAQMSRWPELVPTATDLGISSVLATPLLAREKTWGVLDVYDSGRRPWSSMDVAGVGLLAGIAAHQLAAVADLRDAAAAQAAWQHRATHDSLTGLPNRALLLDRLDHALRSGMRHRGAVAVLFIDIDRFKTINDTWGHSVGDSVLVEVANRLIPVLRESDTLARMSGDEFVVVCEDLHRADAGDHSGLHALSDRIHAAMEPMIVVGPMKRVLTLSIGMAVSSPETIRHQRPSDLLGAADSAMYEAKRKNRPGTAISLLG